MSASFLQPGAVAWLRRWGETLAGAVPGALGAWWFVTAHGLLAWAGAALALGGGAAAVVSFQKARFASRGGGVGVVHLDEGRLTYFGPLTGGSVVVREIASVGIDPRHRPAHWVLRDDEAELMIPVDAEGADVLFDVFATLPGLSLRSVMAARDGASDLPSIFWRREGAAPVARRLH